MTTKEVFQSTPPARGATLGDEAAKQVEFLISIHAPREGGDCTIRWICLMYPLFQSTPPARGATSLTNFFPSCYNISIHAPREGGDGGYNDEVITHLDFNPRPPRGGRHDGETYWKEKNTISIHAPREGGDLCFCAGAPVIF